MNPEFKRNLILSSTPFRQFVLPSAMLACIYIFYLVNGQFLGKGLAIACAIVFLVVMLLWGTREVSDSLMDEMVEKTWDFQRMSSMGAWSMVWGKILGSSFYVILSALIALIAYMYSIASIVSSEFLIKSSLLLLLLAGIGLSVSFLSTLFLLRKNPNTTTKLTNGVILFLGIYLLITIIPFIRLEQFQSINWYKQDYDWLTFNLVSALSFLTWLLIANYRLMRQELQYKNSPLIWTIFIVFVLFYCGGFLIPLTYFDRGNWIDNGEIGVYLKVLAPSYFFLLIIITWFSIYFSDNSIKAIHRLLFSCSKTNIRNIWLYSPLWLISYILLLISGVWFYLNSGIDNQVGIFLALWHVNVPIFSIEFIIMCLLFVLRDILISLYFSFKNSFRRPDSSALIFILLLYLLIPTIVNMTAGSQWLFIFIPLPNDVGWYHILPVLIQVMVMAGLNWNYYHQKSPQPI